MKRILFVFSLALLILPISVLAQTSPTASTVKLQVSNFVPNPGDKLGSDENNRKYQCEMIVFDIQKFNRNDSEIKPTIKAKLDSLKISLVDTEADFIKLDKSARASTAIYEKLNDKATSCPSDTATFTKSSSSNTTASTSSENDKCTSDAKTITVAINNYPSLKDDEIKDNKFYTDKIGANFMCSHVKVPVSKPKEGIKANLAEIKKYLTEEVTGISLINDREQFDKLSASEMKKSVILSTLKCSCEGPNSIDYTGISFKDNGQLEKRKSTAAEPNQMSIGYNPNPNSSPSSNSSSSSTDTNQQQGSPTANQSVQVQKTVSPQKTKTATPNPTPYKLDGNCIKVSGQLVCFIDEESKNLYRQGKLTNLLKTTAGAIQQDIGITKDHHGYVDMVAFGSSTNIPNMYRKATGSAFNPQAFACVYADYQLCNDITKKALGSIPKKNMKIIVTRATEDSSNQWSTEQFKLIIDHEWSHIYDTSSTFRESYDSISSNPKYSFTSTYATIKNYSIQTSDYSVIMKSYPKCFSGALLYANDGGAPWLSQLEVFASTFEDFHNSNARSRMNSGLIKYGSPSNCKQILDKTIDQHKSFFN